MGVKIVRFCEKCLQEFKEEIYTKRKDLKGSLSPDSITVMIDLICDKCKKCTIK